MYHCVGGKLIANGIKIELKEWTLDSNSRMSGTELRSQLKGGSKMGRKMKVGDKLMFVSDRPMDSWIGAKLGDVYEVVDGGSGSPSAWKPGAKYSDTMVLCCGRSWGEEYLPSGTTGCGAWRVIN